MPTKELMEATGTLPTNPRLVAPFRRQPDWLMIPGTPECEARVLLALFARYGIPRDMLDLGCGSGGWTCRIAAALGVTSYGVDISCEDTIEDNFSLEKSDLSIWGGMLRKFELVISWETGEHLPEDSADHLVDMLTQHATGLVVFTAAVPGQGGDGHINCQPQEYWRDKFQQHGFTHQAGEVEILRDMWKASEGLCSWYSDNLQIFTSPDFSGWAPWSED